MRCRGCNNELGKYEIIWRKDINQFEDLCRQCRKSIVHITAEEEEQTPNLPHITHYEDEYEED